MKKFILLATFILLSGFTYGFAVPVLVSARDSLAVMGGMLFAFFAPLVIFNVLKYLNSKDFK